MKRIHQIVDGDTGEIMSQRVDVGQSEAFLQLFKNKLPDLRKLIREEPTAAELLLCLMEKIGRNNAVVISRRAAAQMFGLSDRTITRAYATLKEHGLITMIQTGGPPLILISKDICWQGSAAGRRLAITDAAVIVAEADQSAPKRGPKPKKVKTINAPHVVLTGQNTIFPIPSVEKTATRIENAE